VRQSLPAAADADHLAADFTGAVDNCLDDGIEAGDIAATGQNPDASRWHEGSLSGNNLYGSMLSAATVRRCEILAKRILHIHAMTGVAP
jgi:hypothetical protein